MFIRKSVVALASLAVAGASLVGFASQANAAVAIDCTNGASPPGITGAGPFEFVHGATRCIGYNVRTSIDASDVTIEEYRTGSGWVVMPNNVVLNAGGPSGENTNGGLRITVAPGASGTVYVDFYLNQYNTLMVTYTITIGGGGGAPAPAITGVNPASGPDAGGTSVTISGTNLDNATSVTFGSAAAATFTVDDSTQITATTPPGTAGAVDVVVSTPGGDDTSVGAFTYTAAPTPTPTPAPATPPSAPTVGGLIAGDREVTISWNSPMSHGTFPVTNYQVQSTPTSSGCLVPASQTQCTISDLSDGTSYSFQVRALNGGGWGPWLDVGSATPSPAIEATILISGTRGDVRGKPGVLVDGMTTGITAGSILHPWIRLPDMDAPAEGVARIRVNEAGTFTWQRRTSKPIDVQIRSADGSVRSDYITIAAR